MSQQNKIVAVTGATGFVGRHVVRRLVEGGWSVRCLVRSRDKAASVLPEPGEHVSWVIGDVFDGESLGDLLSGAAAVVHTIGIRRESPPRVTFARLHPGATRAVIEQARRHQVDRFIHISALGTGPDGRCDYHRSKYASEQLVRGSGLMWTILRPSLIHGPDGEFMQMVKAWVLGRSPPFLFIPWFARVDFSAGLLPRPASAAVQPIAVGDVALAVERCLERDEAIGEVYPLGGEEVLDWPALMAAVREALPLTDRRKRIIPVPGKVCEVHAKLARTLGLDTLLPVGPSEPVMATQDSACSLAKVSDHLDLAPGGFTATLGEYAQEI